MRWLLNLKQVKKLLVKLGDRSRTYRNKNQDKRWHRKGIVKDVWWRRHDRYRCNRSGKGLYSNNVTAKTWRDAYTVYKG